jgi:hypothetical protein
MSPNDRHKILRQERLIMPRIELTSLITAAEIGPLLGVSPAAGDKIRERWRDAVREVGVEEAGKAMTPVPDPVLGAGEKSGQRWRRADWVRYGKATGRLTSRGKIIPHDRRRFPTDQRLPKRPKPAEVDEPVAQAS